MTLEERARLYIQKCPASVSGSAGHTAAFRAAVALVLGFQLDEERALAILKEDFNPRCLPPWSDRDLRHKVNQAKSRGTCPPGGSPGWLIGDKPGSPWAKDRERAERGPAPAPEVKREARPDFDLGTLEKIFRPEWARPMAFTEVSPVRPAGVSPAAFLQAVYGPADRIMIFSDYYSQGDFAYWKGRTFRLGKRPNVRAVPSPLPTRGPKGIWFCAQPVDLEWHATDRGRLSRRTAASVTDPGWMVLEHDPAKDVENREEIVSCYLDQGITSDVPFLFHGRKAWVSLSDHPEFFCPGLDGLEVAKVTAEIQKRINGVEIPRAEKENALWLSFLAQLRLPIAAVYSSGGKSIHALVKLTGVKTQPEWQRAKEYLGPTLAKYGADPQALSVVRLTRLPGCYRGGRRQQLLYLNPRPDPAGVPICNGGHVPALA